MQNWKSPLKSSIQLYKNHSLKLSRCAEDEECNAYAILRNRVKASQDSKRKVPSSIGEDMRALYLLRFWTSNDTYRSLESSEIRILGAECCIGFELLRECSVN